ncbi:hypothetical protein T484DRAFT_1895884 [Baffinella frigidus]|nr:hypothetical protein T484DRAFT_1895884 [Cryptophyta sp. CCMP2293]
MLKLPRGSHAKVVSATAAALLCACVVVLVAVGNEGVVPREAELLAVPRQASLRGAIAQLASAEHASKGRMEQLAPMNWLEKIYGRDNTYDFAGISALKAGDVSEVGYEGMPQAKGVIPSPQAMTAAETLLKHAITMPADVTDVWDGQPYVPSDEFKQKLTNAWAGFHQAIGEKRWEAKVLADCAGKTTVPRNPRPEP